MDGWDGSVLIPVVMDDMVVDSLGVEWSVDGVYWGFQWGLMGSVGSVDSVVEGLGGCLVVAQWAF